MNKLLIIDPQNDFCDIPGAALPVPGAIADLGRIASLIKRLGNSIGSIIATFDVHASVGIERPGFWLTQTGELVAPFTKILYQDVFDGKFRPRVYSQVAAVLSYLKALEAGGKYELMVWPPHCIEGTWGAAMPDVLGSALYEWEFATLKSVTKVRKGMNPMTEQYSPVRAEVPLDDATDTNFALIRLVTPDVDDRLFIGGEASSHCVRAMVMDLIRLLPLDLARRVILLEDCMSPVPGFETQAADFVAYCRRLGVQVMTCDQAVELCQEV